MRNKLKALGEGQAGQEGETSLNKEVERDKGVRFATPLTDDQSKSATTATVAVSSSSHTAIAEREQYLRQAFYSLFCADSATDMQNINRCALMLTPSTPPLYSRVPTCCLYIYTYAIS